MSRKSTPHVERKPCSACGGSGVKTWYDEKTKRSLTRECPSCGGSGKQ